MESVDLRGYISVDIEASGPSPEAFAMLSLGAVSLADLEQAFYIEFRPTSDRVDPQAMAVHGLSLETLARTGVELGTGLQRFATWVRAQADGQAPVFVAYNAPFDWMFVNAAFHAALGANPFGHAPLDVRAYHAGLSGADWKEIRFDDLADRYLGGRRQTHNALDDARVQAELFLALLRAPRTASTA